HVGSAVRRDSADVRHRVRCRVAPAPGPSDGRRLAGQPGADAVHHTGHLSLLRSHGAPVPPFGQDRGGGMTGQLHVSSFKRQVRSWAAHAWASAFACRLKLAAWSCRP
nr:hypothetical protein [Tanacetum cinerariifolium]